MGGYLLNFIVYTTAMIGIIFLAVFVYKKCSITGSAKSNFLNIEDCISLAPRKNLYVVRAGQERFLVASDAERTSLISKLDGNSSEQPVQPAKQDENSAKIDDLPTIVNFQKKTSEPKKVFKNIINNI